MVFDARFPAGENLLSASEVQCDSQPGSEPHKRIPVTIQKHMARALHVGFLVADKRVCFKNFGHPVVAKPPLKSVFAKWAVTAWTWYVR